MLATCAVADVVVAIVAKRHIDDAALGEVAQVVKAALEGVAVLDAQHDALLALVLVMPQVVGRAGYGDMLAMLGDDGLYLIEDVVGILLGMLSKRHGLWQIGHHDSGVLMTLRHLVEVDKHSEHVAIARTPDDLWLHKHQGRKSIMLGIENGHALEGSLDNLRHFAQRGIVYMTLCHNGDNDICDSARGEHTHHGVSTFGREVISEMNRLGIMVDLSHAGEKSFYDALELSRTPIVCSHSSCRVLCDHPRNLTDDQMRALAQHGGVMQVTLYHGFLVKDGDATLDDAMRHLEHAIEVMGIDHVGLGTDFDGDGGIRGLASSAELLNYTRELLKWKFSEADIQKLWGGNFLRVMRQVQHHRTSAEQ